MRYALLKAHEYEKYQSRKEYPRQREKCYSNDTKYEGRKTIRKS